MLRFILFVWVIALVGACANRSLEQASNTPEVVEVPDSGSDQAVKPEPIQPAPAPDGYGTYKWGTSFEELRKDFPSSSFRRNSGDREYRDILVSNVAYADHVADMTFKVKDNVGLDGVRIVIYLKAGKEEEAKDVFLLLVNKYGDAVKADMSKAPIRLDCYDWDYGKMSNLRFCMMVSMLKQNTLEVSIMYSYNEDRGVAINQDKPLPL
jgi:hypothetical protein